MRYIGEARLVKLVVGCSSVGRAPDCDSGGRGFEPHQSPQFSLFCNYRLNMQCNVREWRNW